MEVATYFTPFRLCAKTWPRARLAPRSFAPFISVDRVDTVDGVDRLEGAPERRGPLDNATVRGIRAEVDVCGLSGGQLGGEASGVRADGETVATHSSRDDQALDLRRGAE